MKSFEKYNIFDYDSSMFARYLAATELNYADLVKAKKYAINMDVSIQKIVKRELPQMSGKYFTSHRQYSNYW